MGRRSSKIAGRKVSLSNTSQKNFYYDFLGLFDAWLFAKFMISFEHYVFDEKPKASSKINSVLTSLFFNFY